MPVSDPIDETRILVSSSIEVFPLIRMNNWPAIVAKMYSKIKMDITENMIQRKLIFNFVEDIFFWNIKFDPQKLQNLLSVST